MTWTYRSIVLASTSLLLGAAISCGDQAGAGATDDGGIAADAVSSRSVPILGAGSHGLSQLELKTIADGPTQGLNRPTDLAFHPTRKNELWITSQRDNSVVLIFDPGTAQQKHGNSKGSGAQHFLAQPAALAFSDNGNFATVHETDQATQPSTPATFMGPTLWSSDLTLFDGGFAGHHDMLHNSPLAMGIAWERENTFWVFDGYHAAITRYAFNADHGPGGSDHSDGDVARYVEGEVARVANVPSHLAFDAATGLVWVADTGNNRIATLDAKSGTKGSAISPNYDRGPQYKMTGARLKTVVDGPAVGLQKPSGIALRDGLVFVSDNGTGRIWAFDPKTGAAVDWLDTGVGPDALAGIAFDGAGRLYFVDMAADRVLRLAPR